MENIELFFGFPVANDFAVKFHKVNPNVRSMFINDQLDSLQNIVVNNNSFIGKNVGKIADLDALHLLEAHITSILKKLVPDYNYESNSLVLFPFIHDK